MSEKNWTPEETIAHGRGWIADDAGWSWAVGQVVLMALEHENGDDYWRSGTGDPLCGTVIRAVITAVHGGQITTVSHIGGGFGSIGDAFPDLRDAGTRGHARAQVREAPGVWAVDIDEDPHADRPFRVKVWCQDVDSDRMGCCDHFGETLSEALLAARMSAP